VRSIAAAAAEAWNAATAPGVYKAMGIVMTSYGIPLEVRPLVADDRDRLAGAFASMSAQTRYERFLGPKPRLTTAELTFLTEIDHCGHEALGAFDPIDGRLVAIARYVSWPGEPGTADLACVVTDAWQGQGIGTLLTRRLLSLAARNGIRRLTASTFAANERARALLRKFRFCARWTGTDVIELDLALTPAMAPA
jgi:RimJ/RimL family protein N-acetyltransferase